jgi:hypothetical protein
MAHEKAREVEKLTEYDPNGPDCKSAARSVCACPTDPEERLPPGTFLLKTPHDNFTVRVFSIWEEEKRTTTRAQGLEIWTSATCIFLMIAAITTDGCQRLNCFLLLQNI